MKVDLDTAELERLYSALKYRSTPNDPLVLKLERLLVQAISNRKAK